MCVYNKTNANILQISKFCGGIDSYYLWQKISAVLQCGRDVYRS